MGFVFNFDFSKKQTEKFKEKLLNDTNYNKLLVNLKKTQLDFLWDSHKNTYEEFLESLIE